MDRYIDPMKLVARLKVIKVSAVVPDLRLASAHRVASRTEDVNSASTEIVIWDARPRIRMLLSGFLDTNKGNIGLFKELLYAKKIVNDIRRAVMTATTTVNPLFCRQVRRTPDASFPSIQFWRSRLVNGVYGYY